MQIAISASTPTQLYHARSAPRTLAYKCQLCERPAALKQGRIRRPHFCHIIGHCGSPEGEWRRKAGKESEEHLQAKESIARLLEHDRRVTDTETECRIKLPDQKSIVTDLMLWRGHEPLAIEVQKSNIDADDFSARCSKYAQAEVPVLWVFVEKVPYRNTVLYLKEWQKRCAGNNFGYVFYLLAGGRVQPIKVTPLNEDKTGGYQMEFYRQELSVADLKIETRAGQFINPRHPSRVGVLPAQR
jgi:hypothetical protein